MQKDIRNTMAAAKQKQQQRELLKMSKNNSEIDRNREDVHVELNVVATKVQSPRNQSGQSKWPITQFAVTNLMFGMFFRTQLNFFSCFSSPLPNVTEAHKPDDGYAALVPDVMLLDARRRVYAFSALHRKITERQSICKLFTQSVNCSLIWQHLSVLVQKHMCRNDNTSAESRYCKIDTTAADKISNRHTVRPFGAAAVFSNVERLATRKIRSTHSICPGETDNTQWQCERAEYTSHRTVCQNIDLACARMLTLWYIKR